MRFKSFFAAAILVLCAIPVSAEDFKLGVVNISKLLAEYPEAKAANAQLQKDAEKKKKSLEGLGKEIETLAKEYTAGKGKFTEKQLKEKEYVIRKKKEAFDRLRESAEAEIDALQSQAGREVYDKLKVVIAEVAKAEGVDLVLEGDSTLYAKNRVDLTDKVTARFKKGK